MLQVKHHHTFLYDAVNRAYIAMSGGNVTAHLMGAATSEAILAVNTAVNRPADALTLQDQELLRALRQFIGWRKSGSMYSNQDFDVKCSLLSAMDYHPAGANVEFWRARVARLLAVRRKFDARTQQAGIMRDAVRQAISTVRYWQSVSGRNCGGRVSDEM